MVADLSVRVRYIHISITKKLVKMFGLESTSSVRTPMSPNVKLIVDLLGKNVDLSLYRSLTGSVLYLTASRPDIIYSVGVCARY